MSRDFTKDTANYCSLPADSLATMANGATVLSLAAWVQADSLTASANNNRIVSVQIATSVTGFTLLTDASSHLRVGGRSQPGDTFQTKDSTTVIATNGNWTHVGGVLNFTGDTITPYLNGIAEGGGAVTFGSNTWAQGVNTGTLEGIGAGLTTGAPANTDLQFDGRICDVAVWRGDIGAAGFARLALLGADPRSIAPLMAYFPMYGGDAVHNQFTPLTATITGSIPPAPDPPCVVMRLRRLLIAV